MKKELEEKFQSEFPQFFVDLNGDPRKTCMSRAHGGIAIGPGWEDLFYKLCTDLKEVAGPDFKFEQVKEKFGQLRIYTSGGNEDTRRLIDKAEDDSASVCESCGTTEGVTLEGAWITAKCHDCRYGNKEVSDDAVDTGASGSASS